MKTTEQPKYENSSTFEKIGGYGLIAFAVIMLIYVDRAIFGNLRASADMRSNFVELKDTVNLLPENNGKMVYFRAFEQFEGDVVDPDFGVGGHYLAVSRNVEYYQWVETSTTTTHKYQDGEVEETTEYSYDKGWTKEPVDSRSFDDSRYKNKAPLVLDAMTITTDKVKMGPYYLGDYLKKKAVSGYEKTLNHKVDMATASKVLANASEKMKVHLLNKEIYYGEDPAHPSIGDVRVSFQVSNPNLDYVLAKVDNDKLVPYYVPESDNNVAQLSSFPIDLDYYLEYGEGGAIGGFIFIAVIAWLFIVWGVYNLRGKVVYPLRNKRLISRIIPKADNKLTLWIVGTYLSIFIILICHILSKITT